MPLSVFEQAAVIIVAIATMPKKPTSFCRIITSPPEVVSVPHKKEGASTVPLNSRASSSAVEARTQELRRLAGGTRDQEQDVFVVLLSAPSRAGDRAHGFDP